MRRIAANYVFPVIAPPIRNGILEMEDTGEILRVIDPGKEFRESRKMEFYNGILVPGFINAHSHLELACLKGRLPRHAGLKIFLMQVMKLRDACSPAARLQAMQDADRQMKDNGIVAAGDVSNTDISFRVKADSAIAYHTFIEMYGFTDEQVRHQKNKGKELLQKLRHGYGLRGHLTAHASYSADRRLIRHVARENSQEDNPVFSFHYRESTLSCEFMLRMIPKLSRHYREKSLEWSHWKPSGLKQLVLGLEPSLDKMRVLLVHNLHTTDRAIMNAGQRIPRLTWVLCPRSNIFIHNRLPRLLPFIRQGQAVALGTDSLASNEGLSILEEMKVLAWQHPEVPFDTLLEWATINGARAVCPDGGLGCFEPGTRPGVNLIRPFDFSQMRLTADSRVFPLA